MELKVLCVFSFLLLGCIFAGIPLLAALAAGYFLFFGYGRYRGYGGASLLQMSLEGVRMVKNILLLFILIGILTALWRAAGTIPAIVYYAAGLIQPSVFLVLAFWLNSVVSFLTGTSFGTAATMGVVCMTVASSLGIDTVWAGGAVLSGAYFGDRCSPVSSSALLVAELTQTDIFHNVRLMMKTALVPFAATSAVYGAAGWYLPVGPAAASADIGALFSSHFAIDGLVLLPAAVILVFMIGRASVKKAMLVSIAAAAVISIVYQQASWQEILSVSLTGYYADDPVLGAMINGGGIWSMAEVTAIVCLSSSYAGLFEGTGLLLPVKEKAEWLGKKISPAAAVLASAAATAAITCNQALAVVLTRQLCEKAEPDRQRLAILLENTVIVICGLIPWSIAAAVPLASIGASSQSIFTALYLYLIPAWTLFLTWNKKDWL